LHLSHGVAVILLFIYGSYLVFQLWSHANLYLDDGNEQFQSITFAQAKHHDHTQSSMHVQLQSPVHDQPQSPEEVPAGSRDLVGGSVAPTNHDPERQSTAPSAEAVPKLSFAACIVLLIVDTVLVSFTADFLVDSINGLTASGKISKEWVGLILLPIVGNAAEHVTAVTVSVKDKLTLSLGVAVGSSIQIALFVIPLLVVIAWIGGKPLTMLFDPFESVVLFLTVLTVNYVVQDGKTNWLEGMILMNLYVIIAVSFWFYPGSDPASTLLTCI